MRIDARAAAAGVLGRTLAFAQLQGHVEVLDAVHAVLGVGFEALAQACARDGLHQPDQHHAVRKVRGDGAEGGRRRGHVALRRGGGVLQGARCYLGVDPSEEDFLLQHLPLAQRLAHACDRAQAASAGTGGARLVPTS